MKFIKLKSAEQPTTPKPTTTLPNNMTWAWDPKANQWIAVMKDNPVVTPPTYNPNNVNNLNNTTTTQMYTPVKAADKEKTMQEYENEGCDTTNLMKACQHIYYGFYDEIKNKWSPEKLLNYMEKRLDNAKNNPDEAKFEKNWATSRFPEAIELVKQFIENCNGKKEIKSKINKQKALEIGAITQEDLDYLEKINFTKNYDEKAQKILNKYTKKMNEYEQKNIKSKNVKSSSRALSVLPRLLDKVWYDYDEEDAGRYAQIGSWEIGLGGYDTGYEVSYQGTPIFSITEDNRFKPYFSNDRLQDEFGFSYSDIERALKKHRDLVDIKMIDASKNNEYWAINEDFKSDDKDNRIAVLKYENEDLVDWEFFNTYEEAEKFENKMNKKVKSTLIDSLNQFLDGDKYSREIKLEKGLISGGLIKFAGINPIRGPKYSITDKGLQVLKQAAKEEYNKEKRSYLLDGISEEEFKTGTPQSQGQMPKFSIFEKDGSELAQIEAKNSTDAKVKFFMENPEYEGSQSISVKKVKSSINVDEAKKWLEKTYPMLNRLEKGSDLYNELKEQIDYVENLIYSNKKDAKYSETTTQGLDFPNQSVSPSTDIKVDTKGWVNVQSAKLTPQLFLLGEALAPYIKNNSIQISTDDEDKGILYISGDAKIINKLEHDVRDEGIYCDAEDVPFSDEFNRTYTLRIFLED